MIAITVRIMATTMNNGDANMRQQHWSYIWTLDEKMAQTYIHEDQANTLAARDYKQPQAVILVEI